MFTFTHTTRFFPLSFVAILNVRQSTIQHREEVPSGKSTDSMKLPIGDTEENVHFNTFYQSYISSLCIGLIIGFVICKICNSSLLRFNP